MGTGGRQTGAGFPVRQKYKSNAVKDRGWGGHGQIMHKYRYIKDYLVGLPLQCVPDFTADTGPAVLHNTL